MEYDYDYNRSLFTIILGDYIFDHARKITYHLTYPIFSLLISLWYGIIQSWKDAKSQ